MKEQEINKITIVNPSPDELRQIIMAQTRKLIPTILLYSWTNKETSEFVGMRFGVPSLIAAQGPDALIKFVEEAKGATLVTVLRVSS